jgi:hypothetical protein
METELKSIQTKLKEIYDILGSYIEIMKPKKYKYVNIEKINDFLWVRNQGMYKKQSFYLNSAYHWEIITDDEDYLVLLPTRKDVPNE